MSWGFSLSGNRRHPRNPANLVTALYENPVKIATVQERGCVSLAGSHSAADPAVS